MGLAARGTLGAFIGVLLSIGTAQAADLGGDCCADLEARIAELEATTARKGNRRMSLTISGQVQRSILYWNDGRESGTYAGLDNVSNSSRFIFHGSAAIRPGLKAGFQMSTEWHVGATTSSVDQFSPDGSGTGFLPGDGALAVRTAFWWLEDKRLGRIAVGRNNVGGPVSMIDLGHTTLPLSGAPGDVGGSFFVAGTTRLSSVIGPSFGANRAEGIRYDSPTIGGFVLQGFWGEDDVWSASIRYANELGAFRVATGIGYEAQESNSAMTVQIDYFPINIDNEWSAGAAILHTPTGLFAQGQYSRAEFFNGGEGTHWVVQGGIARNWFGPGTTSLYGEYGESTDFIKSGPAVEDGSSAAFPNFLAASSEVNYWGAGVVQKIDAAAMDIYVGWRRLETDVSGILGPDAAGNGSSDLDLISAGARIRF